MKRFLKANAVLLLFFTSTILVLLISIITNTLMNATTRMLSESTEQRLLTVAKSAATLVTAEELEEFRSPPDMKKPLYNEIKERLEEFSLDHGVLYTYFLRPENGQMQFVVDNDWDPDTRVDLNSEAVEMEPAPSEALAGTAAVSAVGDYSVDWDGILAAFAPVYDEAGYIYCVAGVDISDTEVVSTRRNMMVLMVVQLICLVIAILSGLFGLLLYRRKAQQSESANTAKSDFLSRMSHEIRSPMNAIIGLCRMAKASNDLPEIQGYLDNIGTSSAHLLRLINDILDLSKIESGKVVFDLAPVRLRGEIDNVSGIIQPQADAKGQYFGVDISPDLPTTVYADSTHLRQVVVNLLSNAVKFTPEGGEITLSVRPLDTRNNICNIEFCVRDTGIGIAAEKQESLFEPFEQGDTSTTRLYGGTGLGLSISKQLVEMMDGHISVNSELGAGSEFIFNIWLEIAPDTLPQPAATPTASSAPPNLHGKTILVVEDSEINQLVAENLFAGMGAEVDLAENGLVAVNKFLASPARYDLIFMDVQMPVMDGYDATRQIRGSSPPNAQAIPIIAMTANVFKEDVQHALDAGMNAHVGKPFDVEQVEQAVAKALKN